MVSPGLFEPCMLELFERNMALSIVRLSVGQGEGGEYNTKLELQSLNVKMSRQEIVCHKANLRQDIPISVELYQLVAQNETRLQRMCLKEMLLQISQFQMMVSQLDGKNNLKRKVEKGKKILDKKNQLIKELTCIVAQQEENQLQMERQYKMIEGA